MADGGAVDAGQGAGHVRGQVQVLGQPPGDDVVGEVDLAAGGGAVGDRLDAAVSAAGVSGLLAVGAEGDLQRGGQVVQIAGIKAGQRGVVQGLLRDAPGWFRPRGRGRGRGTGRTA